MYAFTRHELHGRCERHDWNGRLSDRTGGHEAHAHITMKILARAADRRSGHDLTARNLIRKSSSNTLVAEVASRLATRHASPHIDQVREIVDLIHHLEIEHLTCQRVSSTDGEGIDIGIGRQRTLRCNSKVIWDGRSPGHEKGECTHA